MKLKLLLLSSLVSVFAFTSCNTKKLEAAQTENTRLNAEVSTCNTNLKDANAKIADLNGQLSTCAATNAALSQDAAAYKKLKEDIRVQREQFNAALAEQDRALKEIRDKIIASLSSLADSGITVEFQSGLLYVTLPEVLLFKEGSASLGPKAKSAFSPLASVLNNYPKVQIYVVGNTDSKPIHTAVFKDNWTLSTERANSIVRILRDSYSVDPTRLLAGGRSKYNPVADNATKEGRAQNRRIQIILNPDLSKLWEMMEK
jgi:chemotaxis protein MotB